MAASRARWPGTSSSQRTTSLWIRGPGGTRVPKVPSISGRSVLRRTTTTGLLSTLTSSWMPPESDTTTAALPASARKAG